LPAEGPRASADLRFCDDLTGNREKRVKDIEESAIASYCHSDTSTQGALHDYR
jgi:hypothetical protein